MLLTPPETDSIADASQAAVDALTALSKSAQNSLKGDDDAGPRLGYCEEIERLSLWIDDHGIRSGTLDHKLREASHLRNRVLSLLAELSGTVKGAKLGGS